MAVYHNYMAAGTAFYEPNGTFITWDPEGILLISSTMQFSWIIFNTVQVETHMILRFGSPVSACSINQYLCNVVVGVQYV